MAKKSATGNEIYNIVALCFADRHTAGQVAKEVRSQQKLAGYKVVVEAVVEVDEKGKTHIHEPGKGGVGGTAGGVVGAALGLIGGPAGLLAWTVAGAAIGGISGHYLGRLIPKHDLEELGKQMTPNSSAYLALVEDKYAEAVVDELQGYKAKVVTLTVADEASQSVAITVAADVTAPGAATATSKPAADASSKEPAKSDSTKPASEKSAS